MKGVVTVWNPAAETIFGWKEKEVLGRPYPLIQPDRKEEMRTLFDDARAGRLRQQIEVRRHRKDGREVDLARSATILSDKDGKDSALLLILADISQRKEAEHQLQERQTFIETIIANVPIGLAVFSSVSGKITYMNRRYEAIHGWPVGIFSDPESFFPSVYPDETVRGEIRDAILQSDQWSARNEWTEVTVLTSSGARRVVTIKNIPLPAQEIVISSVWDVTEMKDAEDKVRQLSHAVEQSPASIVITDLEGRIEYVNPRFSQITGYTSEEAVGQKTSILKSGLMPAATYEELWRVIGAGGEWRGEFLNRRKSGDLYWEFASISAIRDANGRSQYYLAVKEDVTSRKQAEAELIAAKERAEQSDRLKNAFIATMSHEIRTPLNIIMGFVQLLQSAPPEELPDMQSYVTSIERAAQRLMRTVEELLHISSLEAGTFKVERSVQDLCLLLRDLTGDLRGEITARGLEFRLDVTVPRAAVLIDRYTIEQALQNLIDNALKYTESGSIGVSLGIENGEALLAVSDTGIGIGDEFIDRVFDVFSQEKTGYSRPYDGLGLGLALTRRYVELNGGRIAVQSVKGKGSTFTVALPLHTPDAG